MASPKTTKKPANGQRNGYSTLVPLDFSFKERQDISAWLESREVEVQQELLGWTEAGFKISFSWSDHYSSFFISITCKVDDSDYHGLTYSLKHPDLIRGMEILGYVRAEVWPNGGLPIPNKSNGDYW